MGIFETRNNGDGMGIIMGKLKTCIILTHDVWMTKTTLLKTSIEGEVRLKAFISSSFTKSYPPICPHHVTTIASFVCPFHVGSIVSRLLPIQWVVVHTCMQNISTYQTIQSRLFVHFFEVSEPKIVIVNFQVQIYIYIYIYIHMYDIIYI